MKKTQSCRLMFVMLLVVLFVSVGFVSAQSAVDLGTAGNFVILAKSGISTTGTTSIVGNIGVSPAAASYITGFGPVMDSSNQFTTSSLVTGKIYAADYATPTPATMTAAISDMEKAYTDALGRTNTTGTESADDGRAGEIGGTGFSTPGLWKWTSPVTISTGDFTLNCNGDMHAVYILQLSQTLDISSGKHIILQNGCQAQNIFWQVAGKTTIGTNAVFNGNILDKTAIVLKTGATLNGRALAQTAVTLDANKISVPPLIISPPSPVLTTIKLSVVKEASMLSRGDGFSIIGEVLTSAHITAGSLLQLNATGLDQFGAPMDITINYMTSNSSVAWVDALTGKVTAVAPGSAIITSMWKSNAAIKSSVIINVVPISQSITPSPVLTTIKLSLVSLGNGYILTSANMTVGSTLRVSTTGFDQFGTPIPLTGTFTYSTNNASVFTVDPTTGLVSALAPGSTLITVSSGTIKGFAGIIVSAPSTTSLEITPLQPPVNSISPPLVNLVFSSGGGGGSNSGSSSSNGCSTNWKCSDWSMCSNGQQTRTCTQGASSCSSPSGRPASTQSCALAPTQITPPSTTHLTVAPPLKENTGWPLLIWILIALILLELFFVILLLIFPRYY